ncbi:hypothetical protein P7C73_g5615, partial [Tremellales sp. Uapishka_1]
MSRLGTPSGVGGVNTSLGGKGFAIDSYNVHRLVIAGVTVASKFFSDVFYTNSRYAKVGGLPPHELNQLELQFLLLNDFRLVIPVEEMQRYGDRLLGYWEGKDESTSVEGPDSDTERGRRRRTETSPSTDKSPRKNSSTLPSSPPERKEEDQPPPESEPQPPIEPEHQAQAELPSHPHTASPSTDVQQPARTKPPPPHPHQAPLSPPAQSDDMQVDSPPRSATARTPPPDKMSTQTVGFFPMSKKDTGDGLPTTKPHSASGIRDWNVVMGGRMSSPMID